VSRPSAGWLGSRRGDDDGGPGGERVKSKAKTELAGGVPSCRAKTFRPLDKAGVPKETANAIVCENTTARLDAVRSSLCDRQPRGDSQSVSRTVSQTQQF
jgi:hypothetical protein